MTATDFSSLIDAPDSDVIHLSEPVWFDNQLLRDYDGRNRTVVWEGDAADDVFVLLNCNRVTFRNFRVCLASSAEVVFLVTRDLVGPGQQTPTACRWENVEIEYDGRGKCKYGYRVDTAIGGGPDANNDLHEFRTCHVNGATESMWYFRGSQSMLHRLTGCGGEAGNTGCKHFVQSIDTWTLAIDGGSTSGLTDYCISLGQLGAGQGIVRGHVCESGRGFLSVPGNNASAIVVAVQNNRYSQYGVDPKPTISVGPHVPALTIAQNVFEAFPDATGKFTPCRIQVRAADTRPRKVGSVAITQNHFFQLTANQAPTIEVGQHIPDVQTMGNGYWADNLVVDRVRVVRIP